MKRKALGKGLGALIREADSDEGASLDVDIDLISLNPDQPRFQVDDERIDQLASSIRENGVLQPVLVRRIGERFQLIAGERRLLAAQRAGLLKIPVVVREVPDNKLLELALVENIQREQLNPIEEAQAYQNLLDAAETTQEDLAVRLGRERSTIANALRLLRLPPDVKTLITQGKLTPGHARALLAANVTPKEMNKAAQVIVDKGWSVRDAERWARGQSRKPRMQAPENPDIRAAADRLRLFLGTKIDIKLKRGANGGGRILIHFYSPEDLDRIYSILMSNKIN